MALNILIIDDSAIIRSVLVKCLSMSGLDLGTIHQAANGRLAYEILGAESIDLVFSDLHMPEMDGIELIHRLDAEGRLADLPVLVISSDRSQERRDDLLARGVRTFLRKPFTPDSIRQKVLAVTGAPS